MIGRKGISPLIAAVLLIAFTMAVASIFGQWAPDLLQSIQGDTREDMRDLASAADAGLEVSQTVFSSGSGNTSVVFQNTGSEELSNFTVTARLSGDEFVQKQVDQELSPAEIATVELNTTEEPEMVRVDNENLPVSDEETVVETSSGTGTGDGSTGTTGTASINPDISGATVEAYSSGNLIESAQTDSNGEYSLSTEPSNIDRLVVSSEKDINLNGQPLYAGAEITSVSSSPVDFNFNESAAWTDVEINGTSTTVANQLESSSGGPYPIANVGMLQAMQENASANYSIVRDIDASETENWNYNSTTGNYRGFDPVENTFTGNFDGESNTIDGLHINRPNEDDVGIFSIIDTCSTGSSQGNFTVSDFNVTGKEFVGYLAGDEFGGGIQNETVNFEGNNDLEGEDIVGNFHNGLTGDDSGCLPPAIQ